MRLQGLFGKVTKFGSDIFLIDESKNYTVDIPYKSFNFDILNINNDRTIAVYYRVGTSVGGPAIYKAIKYIGDFGDPSINTKRDRERRAVKYLLDVAYNGPTRNSTISSVLRDLAHTETSETYSVRSADLKHLLVNELSNVVTNRIFSDSINNAISLSVNLNRRILVDSNDCMYTAYKALSSATTILSCAQRYLTIESAYLTTNAIILRTDKANIYSKLSDALDKHNVSHTVITSDHSRYCIVIPEEFAEVVLENLGTLTIEDKMPVGKVRLSRIS